MTKDSSVLIDSNIVIDIVQNDPEWASWSAEQLSLQHNTLINPIIYAELCYKRTTVQELDQLLDLLGIRYVELPREALFLAAQAFRVYRERGGNKSAPLPDFFIGAHAAILQVPLLTRDTNRYRTYFPELKLICP